MKACFPLPQPRWVAPDEFGPEVALEDAKGGGTYLLLYRLDGRVEALFSGVNGVSTIAAPLGASRPSLFGLSVAAPDEAAAPGDPWAAIPTAPPRTFSEGAFTFPIGPVRGDVMESVSFRLHTLGDEVLHVDVGLGFKSRSSESLIEGRVLSDGVQVAERVTGTTTVAHALAFSQAAEAALGTVVPERAHWIRGHLAETERITAHLGDLANLAASTGLPAAQMELLALKEAVLRANGALSGHRYLRGMVVPGGLAKDLADLDLLGHLRAVSATREMFLRIIDGLDGTPSFLDRLVGAGRVPEEWAQELRPLGPIGRASGRSQDLRREAPYGPYRTTALLDVPVETGGDAFARYRVRLQEFQTAVDWLERNHDRPTGGKTWVQAPSPGAPVGGVGQVEGPRGQLTYVLEIGPDGRVTGCRIASPSRRNWLLVPPAIANRNVLQDVPIIDASFALSVAGADR